MLERKPALPSGVYPSKGKARGPFQSVGRIAANAGCRRTSGSFCIFLLARWRWPPTWMLRARFVVHSYALR